jgi:hypothetical protein
MKKALIVSVLFASSSLVLGCSVHGQASVNAPPPPTASVAVEGQASAQGEAAPPPPETASAQGEIVVQGEPPPPPPPQQESVPPSPGAEFVWVGGYHRWNGHGYGWVGGRYEHRPHAGAEWRAAHWEARGNAHVWIEGNWDGGASGNANANAKAPGWQPNPGPAPAPAPAAGGTHPWYLHALSDLRNARANLERRGGDRQMRWDEHDAVGDIDRAIHDIKDAAIDDGKGLDDHPAIDAHEARPGRLHRAMEALRAARADIDKEEDNAFARGLRGRASHDIDAAIHHTEGGEQEAGSLH